MPETRKRPTTVELEMFLPDWGLADPHERAVKRSTSTMPEISAFYHAMMPQMEEIIEYLDQFPLDEIPKEDQKLAYAALAVCEVDYAVNKWDTPNLETGIPVGDMPMKADFYDRVPNTRT